MHDLPAVRKLIYVGVARDILTSQGLSTPPCAETLAGEDGEGVSGWYIFGNRVALSVLKSKTVRSLLTSLLS